MWLVFLNFRSLTRCPVAMSALTYPVVEWDADNLADMQLVELVVGAARRPIGAVLTKRGRDYCVNSGIDLV